ncbi:MAG: tetratricopeptide repeat protein [Rhodospirillaceae bacterium]|nr:tetratricopeptide repeat protein [Rhodospirillaceae bacterium]
MNTLLQNAIDLHRRGGLAAAQEAYRKVLAAEPKNIDALHLLGVLLSEQGNPEGLALIEQAIALKPDFKDAHKNLGNVLLRFGRLADAERHFRRVAALAPNDANAASDLGAVLLRREQYAEAESCTRRALALQPDLPGALRNMGALLDIGGKPEAARGYYDRILARQPDDADTHYQRAGSLLSQGHFAEGWIELLWRFKRRESYGMYGRLKYPYWQGEDLAGKKIMVWTEQGLGEALILGTMLPDLFARGAEVVLVCTPRLVPLFKAAFPTIGLIPMGEGPVDPALKANVSFQASVSELGRRLRPSFAAFPQKPYLVADPTLTQALRYKYTAVAQGRRIVGISWFSKSPGAEAEKTPSLAHWAHILKTPDILFVSLQYEYGRCAADLAAFARDFGVPVFSDPAVDPMRDLVAFAAQVAAMDLTVSVSNTTVHFAGALGKPVWTMIPSNRGRPWHWFVDRDDSPWYPHVRMFRQPPAGPWDSVFLDIAAALDRWRNTPLADH